MTRDQCIEARVLSQLKTCHEPPTVEQLVAACLDRGLLYTDDQVLRALQRLRRKGEVAVRRFRPITRWEASSAECPPPHGGHSAATVTTTMGGNHGR